MLSYGPANQDPTDDHFSFSLNKWVAIGTQTSATGGNL